jgi:hypothetical protein
MALTTESMIKSSIGAHSRLTAKTSVSPTGAREKIAVPTVFHTRKKSLDEITTENPAIMAGKPNLDNLPIPFHDN